LSTATLWRLSATTNPILGFTVMIAITVAVILDIEYPRKGLFRADAYDQMLIDLRTSMK
jgi:hypothetical protein